jgi:maleate isomerase
MRRGGNDATRPSAANTYPIVKRRQLCHRSSGISIRHREDRMDKLSHTAFARRSLLRGAAAAGLTAEAPLSLTLLASPAKASTHRGILGVIKPRAADSDLVDMIKLLPNGIGVIPVYLNLTRGSREEYGSSYATYEKHIAYLASQKCTVIAIEGAPPFMLLGPAREAEMVDEWKRKYATDMFTSSQNQVNAFRALKAKRILGITAGAGGPEMSKVYKKYFEDSGIGVVAMEGMGVEFKSIPDVSPAMIASFIKKAFAEHQGADAVYILGSALEALPLIGSLERELGVPVVQATAARIWEIQKRLHVREPIKGYGILLETLPP